MLSKLSSLPLCLSATGPHSLQEFLPALLVRWGQNILSTSGRVMGRIGRGHSRVLSISQMDSSLRRGWEKPCVIYELIPLHVHSTGMLHIQYWLFSQGNLSRLPLGLSTAGPHGFQELSLAQLLFRRSRKTLSIAGRAVIQLLTWA